MARILITGVAGFIGYHVAKKLLARGERVSGIDNLNSYYSQRLKQARLDDLKANQNFDFEAIDIGQTQEIHALHSPDTITSIIHLAAQAGVRYSLQNPSAYVHSNLMGHANMLELARQLEVGNMIYASSSSVYGANAKIPFGESDITDDQVSFYGATKKSNELMSNAYSRLYGLSLTGLRFFTVYGPWGRPDMAYWLFAEKMMKAEPIQIFNNGEMSRDFTFIDDIVDGVIAALDRPASSVSKDVPHRVYNLGNDTPEKLMDLVSLIERFSGRSAELQYLPMQNGDVRRTWADISRARKELGYNPKVQLEEGIEYFVKWYRDWRT